MIDLKNKRVLVVGLGKSGLSAAMFLRAQGARVTVSDTRSAVALAKEIPALLEAGIMVESGGHGLLTFRRQDLIVVSPGVPMDTPEVKQVVAFGLPVIGELELASRFLQGRVVAITGSNGKTTTTTLVGKIFEDAGGPTQVGGNIGLPVIELVEKSTPETVNVLEVSSFQLETIEEFHPWIAVILNITPDHLDRHGSFETYVAAKERIFERQDGTDFLVLNGDDRVTQVCASRAKSQVFWFSATKAVRRGAFEGIMRNYRGELAECSTANLFIVKDGAALTPPLEAGLLPGITREFLFEIGADTGIAVREQVLRDEDLLGADEAFLTSTTREIVPIVQVDDRTIGSGRRGPVTGALLAGFRQRAEELTRTLVSRP